MDPRSLLGCHIDAHAGASCQVGAAAPDDSASAGGNPATSREHTSRACGLLPRPGMLRRTTAALVVAAATWMTAGIASASPAVDGTRNLSLGNVARGSSYGTNAVLLNPSNMSFSQTFAIEPMYQLAIQSRTSGVGIVIMDSLNNERVALGLGYLFMRGKPTVKIADMARMERKIELSRFGHEAMLVVSVAIVKRWLSVALKPKYQYTSLRYRDDDGTARNAHDKLNAFGLDASLTVNFAGWAALGLVGTNLTGNNAPAYTDEREIRLENVNQLEGSTIDHGTLSEVADYPLGFAWGASVFPLHHPDFSINADGFHDFSSFKFENYTRLVYGGSAEFVAGPVPIRFGTIWDSRGKGKKDDRVFVSGGIAYVRPPPVGSVGVDVGFGFSQQVMGPDKETVIGFNLGLRIHPDL